MKALRTIAAELIGLLVDDWGYAAMIVGWVAVFYVLAVRVKIPISPFVFLGGLAAIILVFVVRRARRAAP